MTIAVGWVRRVERTEELVVCTDSRLSGLGRWDCCPKLLALPRNDCVIAFAGDTLYAYPMIIQSIAAVSQHPKLLSRALDLAQLKGHLIRVLNNMLRSLGGLPVGQEIPMVQFALAGWCWRRSRFSAWVIYYDENLEQFTYRRVRGWAGSDGLKFMFFIGDLFDTFKAELLVRLRRKGRLATGGFDMEPFEVLRDLLRRGTHDEIGGAPQLIKVYRHMNALPHGVLWPSGRENTVSLLGRPLLEYERSQYLVIDPDTLECEKHANL
jgi:hypothetical protein